MSHNTFLSNSDIILTAIEPDDVSFMSEVENDSSQWVHSGLSAPMSISALLDYAVSYDADPVRAKQLRLIIHRASDKDYLGIVDLFDIDCINSHAFLGIYILGRHRRKGYAKEAIILMTDYAANVLNLSSIAVKVCVANTESLHLFKSLGFKSAGSLKNWIRKGRECFDVEILQKDLLA